MPPAGVVTVVLVSVAAVALAAYLVRVALTLKRVNRDLGRVIAGVGAIDVATRPITPVLEGIADDFAATQRVLEELLAGKSPVRSKPVLVSRLRQRGA
jgi:hypothetical protein